MAGSRYDEVVGCHLEDGYHGNQDVDILQEGAGIRLETADGSGHLANDYLSSGDENWTEVLGWQQGDLCVE